jgi:hypothetical protein
MHPNSRNIKVIFFCAVILIYFVWMDIALFFNLQRWSPPLDASKLTSSKTAPQLNFDTELSENVKGLKTKHSDITVFSPLTVKLIMVDHITHYIHDIIARFLEDALHLTESFPWMSANFVSFSGLACAAIAGKLMLSDKLSYRRIGCLFFEMRNFADSMDGVVFRARAKRFNTYESLKGTNGYNVDATCDGLGGVIICVVILIRFLRNPPHRSKYLNFIKQIYFQFYLKIFYLKSFLFSFKTFFIILK